MCFKTKVMLRYMFPISNVCFQTKMFSKYISNIEPNLMYGFEYFKSKKNTEKKELLIILIFCSLFAQRELFALFVVRTVRMVRTVRTVRRSHCSHGSNCSHCSSFALFEQFTRFAVRTVRYFRKKLLFAVRTVRCEQCERANSEHVCSQFGGPWSEMKIRFHRKSSLTLESVCYVKKPFR